MPYVIDEIAAHLEPLPVENLRAAQSRQAMTASLEEENRPRWEDLNEKWLQVQQLDLLGFHSIVAQ